MKLLILLGLVGLAVYGLCVTLGSMSPLGLVIFFLAAKGDL